MANLVLKLGGSFLTRKDQGKSFPGTIEEIRSRRKEFIFEDRLKSICNQIEKVSHSHQIILVHGAGPFGHSLVSRLKTLEEGVARLVHESMISLNEVVVGALSGTGLRCKTSSPFDLVNLDGRFHTERIVTKMVKEIDEGILPISHGDVVPRTSGGGGFYSVISGDVIARDLSLYWPADKVIMVTDLDGILDKDPSIEEGETLRRVGLSRALEILESRSAKGPDVTGGILEKVKTCRPAILRGIPLQIISGIPPGNLETACEGEEVGTIVECR